ncbi:MAG: hypothetical protein WBF31_07350, partial [Anaerolineae bacterium]
KNYIIVDDFDVVEYEHSALPHLTWPDRIGTRINPDQRGCDNDQCESVLIRVQSPAWTRCRSAQANLAAARPFAANSLGGGVIWRQ